MQNYNFPFQQYYTHNGYWTYIYKTNEATDAICKFGNILTGWKVT